MTNAQIIFNEAVELMKNGKIGKTGRQFEVEDENGKSSAIVLRKARKLLHSSTSGNAYRRKLKIARG